MCQLTNTLMNQIDKKDPTQRLIGLLAQLTDKKLDDIVDIHEQNYQRLSMKIEDSTQAFKNMIEKHNTACPLGMQDKIKTQIVEVSRLKTRVDKFRWLETMQDFPLFGKVFVTGVIAILLLMGLDKITEFIK